MISALRSVGGLAAMDCRICLYHDSVQGAYRSWKVMEFKIQIFQVWKVVELGLGPGKSWKITKWLPHFWPVYMFSAFTYIMIVHCQTRFDLLFSIIMHYVTYSVLYENRTCSIATRLSSCGMENGHKWSWKVLENAHRMVLKSLETTFSFCTHRTLQSRLQICRHGVHSGLCEYWIPNTLYQSCRINALNNVLKN